MERVYIDSNVFLSPVLYNIEENNEAKRCKLFLQKIIENQIIGITSTLTWDEFVWIINATMGKEISEQKGKEFLIFPNLRFVKITLLTLNRAQNFYSKYDIRPRDSIHIASALENKVKFIYSLDKDFDKLDEIVRKIP